MYLAISAALSTICAANVRDICHGVRSRRPSLQMHSIMTRLRGAHQCVNVNVQVVRSLLSSALLTRLAVDFSLRDGEEQV